jgi:hypothetical protein
MRHSNKKLQQIAPMDFTSGTYSGFHPPAVAAGFVFPVLKPADIQIRMAELGAE